MDIYDVVVFIIGLALFGFATFIAYSVAGETGVIGFVAFQLLIVGLVLYYGEINPDRIDRSSEPSEVLEQKRNQ